MATRSKKRTAAGRPSVPAETLDDDVVHDLCAFIRDEVGRTDAALERIGERLLSDFWGGDLTLYEARGPRKHAGLRALAKRADTAVLPISKTALSNAIGIAVVVRTLPADSAFRTLPSSHKVELLPLRDPALIERVARDCAADPAFTVRELRAAVREMKPNGRGRPPMPPFLKAVGALGRVLGEGPTCNVAVTPEEIAAVPYEVCLEAERRLGMVGIHLDRLRRLLASVQLRRSDVGTRTSTVPRSGPAETTSKTNADGLEAPGRRAP